MTVAIVDTGVANLAAVEAAFARLGVATRRARNASDMTGSERVVLPGVGSFGAGMAAIERAGLAAALRAHVEEGRPLLAICLGLQLLAEASDETPGVAGLGVIAGRCRRLGRGSMPRVRLPLLGWTDVAADAETALLDSGFAAFANGYALDACPPGAVAAWANHGGPFLAAFERGSLLACQFHPELSGRFGRAIIERWLGRSVGRARTEAPSTSPGFGSGAVCRVIPCLDVDGGRVVKGVRFRDLRDAGDPAAAAARYAESGADEIVVLDTSATVEGRKSALDTVRAVRRAIDVPLTFGGGVATFAQAQAALDAGADKVAINTAAIRVPGLVERMAENLGEQSTIVSVDARRRDASWEAFVCGGRTATGLDAVAWCEEAVRRGAGELLLTSIDRDGSLAGADTELLAAVTERVDRPVIASGGIGTAGHARAAVAAGADAVLAASIFHDDRVSVAQFKTELAEAGIRVRQ